MNNAANKTNLTLSLHTAQTSFKFAYALNLVVVAMRSGRENYGKVEVYAAATSDAPEMFLGYASDLGIMGAAATDALFTALYWEGYLPTFAV